MTPRGELRSELSRSLVPALARLGFQGPVQISGNALLHDFRRGSPGGTHVVTVQLEKYDRPRFILNLAIEPLDGLDSIIESGGSITQGRLKPKRGATTRAWFRADPTAWQRLTGSAEANARTAVATCIELLAEMETWWPTQRASLHITTFTVTYPGIKHAKSNS